MTQQIGRTYFGIKPDWVQGQALPNTVWPCSRYLTSLKRSDFPSLKTGNIIHLRRVVIRTKPHENAEILIPGRTPLRERMCLISQNKVLEMYAFTLVKMHKEKATTTNVLAAVFLTRLLVAQTTQPNAGGRI